MDYKILKFGASWCGPCKVLDQRLEEFNKCEVIRYDVEETEDDLLAKYKIRNVPTTIIVDEAGNEVGRIPGIFNLSELEEKLKELEDA